MALFLIVQVERELQKLEEDGVISTPSSLARGSSAFSKFTQLVCGTAETRKLELLQTRAEGVGVLRSPSAWMQFFQKTAHQSCP